MSRANGSLGTHGPGPGAGALRADRGPLIEIVKEAVVRHDLRRTILLPTNTRLAVPTDASAYNKADLPVASFISPPLYWNALEDTWEKIAIDQMLPTARAYLESSKSSWRPIPIRSEGGPSGRRVSQGVGGGANVLDIAGKIMYP